MDLSVDLEKRLEETADRITVALDTLIPRVQGPEARLMSAMRYAALGGGKRLSLSKFQDPPTGSLPSIKMFNRVRCFL
jgi:hypothetical protein